MHKRIEELTLNAWPALQTVVHHGWLLRFADGYTKRANSINALYSEQSMDLHAQILQCEKYYAQAGLDVIFKITPFNPPGLDSALDGLGYSLLEPSSVKVLDDLNDIAIPTHDEILIQEHLDERWLTILGEITGLPDKNLAITRKLLSQSVIPYGFFTLYDQSKPVACGIGSIEEGILGLYDIAVLPSSRNRGFGKQLMLHILQWAKAKGASSSYLQVVQHNVPANRLYDGLQYKEIYTYWYRCKNVRD
ncbi:GNAT family N-acetyltransferase [Paenibacillus solani]|uniref:GNAT family N-acetyltransferase n=1 Tax=Paenibacillus solani TaxID=1705565 RepID=UPI003D2A29C8